MSRRIPVKKVLRKPKGDPQPYRHANGSAVVARIASSRITLGPWDRENDRPSPLASRVYYALMTEWNDRGRQPLDRQAVSEIKARCRDELKIRDLRSAERRRRNEYVHDSDVNRSLGRSESREPSLTVNDVFDEYVSHRERDVERPVTEGTIKKFRAFLDPHRQAFGMMPATSFRDQHLRQIRDEMIASGRLCFSSINGRMAVIRAAFKHANKMHKRRLPELGNVVNDLKDVESVSRRSLIVTRRPRTEGQIRLISISDLYATLPHLPTQHLRDMVMLLRLTGMRPSELFGMTPGAIEQTSDVWIYRPEHHKTEHHGYERRIEIPEAGVVILEPYVHDCRANELIFTPAKSEAERASARREARQSYLSCNRSRDARRAENPLRPADRPWTKDTFGRSIGRAVKKAGVRAWTPYDLRHTAATEIVLNEGIERGMFKLGHQSITTTQRYLHPPTVDIGCVIHKQSA